ncbi:CD1375 family protein [Adlercreutzia faecimuris]|uniref:ASCH domain-containing protein n=1 Tax=Adlercreutzia faecimuris TaxID=2897341 RepID=A0ABS9WF87_9ACTN|nr:CD1375 family protein [Adlercreutzia sp. JBNU-10]MCI2241526.1 hypothetical protein [Adlercreutzia sp. JBNU-10]
MKTIAKSYARLIRAGRKALAEVPAEIVPALREVAPDLFEEATDGD